jgi:hypothetical protein
MFAATLTSRLSGCPKKQGIIEKEDLMIVHDTLIISTVLCFKRRR